jgi:hypothetical protein
VRSVVGTTSAACALPGEASATGVSAVVSSTAGSGELSALLVLVCADTVEVGEVSDCVVLALIVVDPDDPVDEGGGSVDVDPAAASLDGDDPELEVPVEPVPESDDSASAMPCPVVIAVPMPRATASAPTRPMYLAWPSALPAG